MHLPPAVSYDVVRSRWHFYALCMLWGSAVLCAVCFSMVQNHSPLAWSGLLAVVICAPLSFAAWRRAATGLLQWDGARWTWSGFDDAPVRALRISLDLQHVIGLYLRADDGRSVWLFPERGTDSLRWLALRRALYAHRSAAPGTTGQSSRDGVWQ